MRHVKESRPQSITADVLLGDGPDWSQADLTVDVDSHYFWK